MSKKDKPTVRPLDYNTVLTIEEALERFEEVSAVFSWVKEKYSGALSSRKKNIKSDHNSMLSSCIGVLLPLAMAQSVQDEILGGKVERGKALFDRIGQMQQDIMLFTSRFKNSGVTLLEGRSLID